VITRRLTRRIRYTQWRNSYPALLTWTTMKEFGAPLARGHAGHSGGRV
jgi:hypothetical protein